MGSFSRPNIHLISITGYNHFKTTLLWTWIDIGEKYAHFKSFYTNFVVGKINYGSWQTICLSFNFDILY